MERYQTNESDKSHTKKCYRTDYSSFIFRFSSTGETQCNSYALLKYCHSNKNRPIVFSVGNNYDIHKLPVIPENLYIFNHIPQLDILKQCDLMITHGGMNTLTECILNKVPVIVYPFAKHWDQNGNAARVVYHGIGIRGNFKKISAIYSACG